MARPVRRSIAIASLGADPPEPIRISLSLAAVGSSPTPWCLRHFHTPPDLVVTSQSSQNTLALSIPYPHPASSAPMTSDRGMRHGTRRQTDTPQPHDHRQLP